MHTSTYGAWGNPVSPQSFVHPRVLAKLARRMVMFHDPFVCAVAEKFPVILLVKDRLQQTSPTRAADLWYRCLGKLREWGNTKTSRQHACTRKGCHKEKRWLSKILVLKIDKWFTGTLDTVSVTDSITHCWNWFQCCCKLRLPCNSKLHVIGNSGRKFFPVLFYAHVENHWFKWMLYWSVYDWNVKYILNGCLLLGCAICSHRYTSIC